MTYYPSHTALKCFEKSAQLLSFTHAAKTLHLTQGAVSHHILKLEAQLGGALFIREGGRLRLTSLGEQYLRHIAPAIQLIEQATDEIRRNGSVSDTIRISTPPTFVDYWLISRLNQFTLEYPKVRQIISIRSGNFDYNGADVSFVLREPPPPNMQAIEVLPLVYRPYIAKRKLAEQLSGKPPGTLSAAALISVLKRNHLLRTATSSAWEGWLRQKGIFNAIADSHIHNGPIYANASLAVQAAVDGVGIALLPDFVMHKSRDAGLLTCLDPGGWLSDKSYYMLWRDGPSYSKTIDTLVTWMKRQLDVPCI